MRFAACLLCLLVLPVTAGLATNFTVDDMLAVATVSIAALSDGGQWLAASGSIRDRIGRMPASTIEEERAPDSRMVRQPSQEARQHELVAPAVLPTVTPRLLR
ncbi:MAG TPA: hypothetical protein VGZ73_20155 [Bryobacteraceae bacterium]|jgi:hypothetical protein|nr:hypothetical protein [Bryobacteraceae bacterium]